MRTTIIFLHAQSLLLSVFTLVYWQYFRYPARTDCPDLQTAVNPEAEDEPWHSMPYSMRNYFFPDFSRNSCGHGRDYPGEYVSLQYLALSNNFLLTHLSPVCSAAWMGFNNYEKHYLFRTGQECCEKFFPKVSACPYEVKTQTDYYWTSYQDNIHNLDDMPVKYNHTYYPDINAGTCVNG